MDENEGIQHTTDNKNVVPFAVVGLLLITAVVAGLFVLTSRNKNTQVAMDTLNQTAEPQVAGIANEEEPPLEETEGLTVNLEAGSFYYAPKEIRVKEGQLVKIIMTSKDMMHDFNIDELGVKIPVTKAGQTATVEFVADRKGEFEYYCSVGQHRLNGQVGKLIVE